MVSGEATGDCHRLRLAVVQISAGLVQIVVVVVVVQHHGLIAKVVHRRMNPGASLKVVLKLLLLKLLLLLLLFAQCPKSARTLPGAKVAEQCGGRRVAGVAQSGGHAAEDVIYKAATVWISS